MKTAESVSASGSDSGRSLDWDEEDEVEVDDGGSVSSDKASLQRHLAQGKTYTLRTLLRYYSDFMILLSFFLSSQHFLDRFEIQSMPTSEVSFSYYVLQLKRQCFYFISLHHFNTLFDLY